MTSPYVAEEAARLKIIARNSSAPVQPIAKSIVSAKAEYRASDYRFACRQTDPAPLEKSPRLENRGTKLLRYLLIALIFAAAWTTTAGIAWILTCN